MTDFLCPVCKKTLSRRENSLKCPGGHCFDISRKGTVNLLLSGKAHHGDDKRMVAARKAFLDSGKYYPLMREICKLAVKYAPQNVTLLDCGCGECSYTAAVSEALRSAGKKHEVIGIDVSKEAINAGASRHADIRLAAASVFDIPLPAESCDIVLALFSPFSGAEYLRVLKKGGFYITAFPLEEHLFELKQAVYDHPYKNTVSDLAVEGFDLAENGGCRFSVELQSNPEIISLFEMTPYCYKTSRSDRAKLDSLESLTVRAEFGTAVYRKL